jgi:hypothetical protein
MMSTTVLPSAWHGVAAPLDLAVPSQLLLISLSARTINNPKDDEGAGQAERQVSRHSFAYHICPSTTPDSRLDWIPSELAACSQTLSAPTCIPFLGIEKLSLERKGRSRTHATSCTEPKHLCFFSCHPASLPAAPPHVKAGVSSALFFLHPTF